jgi:hypothetical protein
MKLRWTGVVSQSCQLSETYVCTSPRTVELLACTAVTLLHSICTTSHKQYNGYQQQAVLLRTTYGRMHHEVMEEWSHQRWGLMMEA